MGVKNSEQLPYTGVTPAPATDLVRIGRPGGTSYKSTLDNFADVLATSFYDAHYDSRYALIGDAYTKAQDDARFVNRQGSMTGAVNTDEAQISLGDDKTNPATTPSLIASVVAIMPTLTQTENTENYIIGLTIDYTINGIGNIGGVQGNYISVRYAGSGTIAYGLYGAQFIPIMESGVTPAITALLIGNTVNPAATVTDSIAMQIAALSGGGSVTNDYGLKIEDYAVGANAYAIYTGTGNVRFGGAFGCNAAVPQPKYASGGTLAGVVAALVANGILLN